MLIGLEVEPQNLVARSDTVSQARRRRNNVPDSLWSKDPREVGRNSPDAFRSLCGSLARNRGLCPLSDAAGTLARSTAGRIEAGIESRRT